MTDPELNQLARDTLGSKATVRISRSPYDGWVINVSAGRHKQAARIRVYHPSLNAATNAAIAALGALS